MDMIGEMPKRQNILGDTEGLHWRERASERERSERRKETQGVRRGQYGDLLPEREAEPNSRSLAVPGYGTGLLERWLLGCQVRLSLGPWGFQT